MELSVKDIHKNVNKRNSELNKRISVNNEVDYDSILSSAGALGRYQLLLLFSTFPFYLFGANVYFSQMFMTAVPSKHWCWIPELKNLTEEQRRDLAIPKDVNTQFGYSQCKAYEANWTEVLLTGQMVDNTWKTVPCQNGWEFDRTEFPYPTISTELGWVCDKNSYQATAQSIFFAGSVAGGILIGWVADRFGRIPAIVGSNLLGCVGGFSSTFAKNLIQFSICRFIMGMAHDTCMMLAFLITLEYMAPKYRSVLSNATFGLFFSFFSTTFPFVALACGHWKTLSLVSSLPLALAILTPVFVPESPRWLLSKGRVDETIRKILFIGRINRKELPKTLIDQFKEAVLRDKHEENVSDFEVFRRPLLRKILILVCLEYMCCQIVFDGLLRNMEQLNFNYFLSFAASSFTEFPSLLLCAFIMDYFGRRWMTVILMTISSISCILIVFVNAGVEAVVCAVIARFVINMSCNTVLQWSAELLPTPARGFGVSIVILSANVAITISPYIAYLKNFVDWLPFVVIGGIAASGAMIALILPETAMKVMPHTYDDAEDLIRNQKFWEIPFLKKKDKIGQGHVNASFELNT